jgi:hypothetical protein
MGENFILTATSENHDQAKHDLDAAVKELKRMGGQVKNKYENMKIVVMELPENTQNLCFDGVSIERDGEVHILK